MHCGVVAWLETLAQRGLEPRMTDIVNYAPFFVVGATAGSGADGLEAISNARGVHLGFGKWSKCVLAKPIRGPWQLCLGNEVVSCLNPRMGSYVRRFWLLLCLVASIPSILYSGLSAQTAPEAPLARSEYLARLERGQLSEDACALINRNGQYRFERRFRSKTDVFLGALSPEQLRSFEEMLNQESLVRLPLETFPIR